MGVTEAKVADALVLRRGNRFLPSPTRGAHARSAVGMAELPFGIPIEIEAQVAIDA